MILATNMDAYVEATSNAISGLGSTINFFEGASIGLGQLLAVVFVFGLLCGLAVYLFIRFRGRG